MQAAVWTCWHYSYSSVEYVTSDILLWVIDNEISIGKSIQILDCIENEKIDHYLIEKWLVKWKWAYGRTMDAALVH